MKKAFLMLLIIVLTGVCGTDTFSETSPAGELSVAPDSVAGTLMAVGDLNFSDGLGTKSIANPDYPWINIKNLLGQATVLIGNLEAPFSNRGNIYTPKTYLFRVDPQAAQALVRGGFDVVSLANNHMMDYGPLCLEDTLFTLNRLQILHAGAGMNLEAARKAAVLITTGGVRFAFLAYSLTYPPEFWAGPDRPGTVYGDPAVFLSDIKKAKAVSDFVVVSFHWGQELQNYPLPYQKAYAHQCVDAGAAIVLGHHPHVLQGLEVYHGGLVAYSLGNFDFGSYSKRTDSIVLAVDYDRRGIIRAKLYPLNINNQEVAFQPKLRHGDDARRVLQELQRYSQEFATRIIPDGDIGLIQVHP